MKRILHITIALLLLVAAGQNAWAETKTVTYTLGREKVGDRNYWALTHSGSTPFDGTTTVESQPEDYVTQATFHLPDGFIFTFNWKGGTVTSVSGTYFFCQNQNVQFSLNWDGTSRYVTNVKVTDENGSPSTLNSSGTATTDYNYAEQGSASYTLKTQASFVKLVITYTDAPGLSIFQSAGTKTYNISTKHDLRHLADYVNNGGNNCQGLTFLQTKDITCDNTYIPIGYYVSNNDQAMFSGTYDGQGHTVSGITVTRTGSTSADNHIGLFGMVGSGGTVQNVVLASSTFTGIDDVGGIVGYSYGTVQNCRVESTVTINAGTNDVYNHGGIVGDNNGTINGCVSAASIQDNGKSNHKYVGGIAGRSIGAVKDCLYTGSTVTADNMKGAIIGYNEHNDGVFTNNYYYTSINLGGVGANGSSSDQNGARRAYTVTLGSNVGLEGAETAYSVSGLTAIGAGNYALRSGSIIYSGAGQTLTIRYTGGDVPVGKALRFSYNDGSDHAIDGNSFTMPAHNVTVSATLVDDLWGIIAYGADGSAEKPFRISTPAGLDLLAQRVNSGTGDEYAASGYSGIHFLQTANLTYDGTENNYTAIGTSSNPFSGHYDGGEKTISGIHINKTGTDLNADCYQGLFGYVDGGTIERLALAGSTIVGYRYVGGIAGYLNGTIQNCRVEADVTLSSQSHSDKLRQYLYFGGVAGYFQSGTIQGCVCGAGIQVKSNCSFYETGGIVGHSGGTLSSNVYYGTSMPNDSFCGAILGSGSYSHNNYYTAITGFPKGKGSNSNERSADVIINGNASYPKLLTLGKHVCIDGEEVEYPFSGLTDLGGKALRYDDGNSVRIFTHLMQSITFSYTGGNVPEGKNVAFSWSSSAIVRPISGNTWNTSSDFYNWHKSRNAFAIQAALVSDPVTITSKPAMGGYWATFYSSASYNLPEGTVAYTMDSNGQLHPLVLNNRSTLKGKEILGCVAVVLFSDKESITLTRINENWDADAFPYENILLGSDDPVPVENGKVDGKTPYVLGVVDGVFGFHPFTGSEIPANKAYFLNAE